MKSCSTAPVFLSLNVTLSPAVRVIVAGENANSVIVTSMTRPCAGSTAAGAAPPHAAARITLAATRAARLRMPKRYRPTMVTRHRRAALIDGSNGTFLYTDKNGARDGGLFVKDALAVESNRETGAMRTRVRTSSAATPPGVRGRVRRRAKPIYGETLCLTSPS